MSRITSKYYQGALNFHMQGAITLSGALLHGAGNSTTRVVSDQANKRFLDYNLENSAATGDNRGMYLRLYHTGAGAGGGEALRCFTTVLNVAKGTCHGAHISLNFGTSGSITGLGVANRNTLHIPAAMSGGTYAPLQTEYYADTSSADVAGTTVAVMHRYVVDGNGTGVTAIDAALSFIDFAGFTAGSGNMIDTDITALTGKASLPVMIDGTLYGYIPIVTGS